MNFMMKTSFENEALLRCSKGELFGENGPRLPAGKMLMLDRITSISKDGGTYGKGRVEAEFDLNPELWFFACHFLNDPIMPACLALDGIWQAMGFFLAWRGFKGRGRALGMGEAKFRDQVLPTARKLSYQVDIKRISERTVPVAIADALVFADAIKVYEAKSMRVGFLPCSTERPDPTSG